MREWWKVKRIGELCNLMTGGTPSKSQKEYFESGEIKWLVSGDVHQKEIKGCKGRITQLGLENSSAKFLPLNSVMIALNGQGKTRGTVALLRTKATCNQSLVSIHPKDLKQLLPEFLYINLHGRYEEIRKITGDSGNDRRGLNMPLVGNIQIPVPPLPEQRRIVAILDTAFEGVDKAIANTEKNLVNARELFESYLNEIFKHKATRWHKKNLDELCNIARGGSPRPIKSFLTNDPSGVNWIKISDATASSKYIYKTKEKIKPEGVRSSRLVHDGDFLLSNSMSFGRPYIMRTSGCIHDGWLVLSDKSGLFDQDYLYYFLGSTEAYRQFDDLAAGTTVRNLNIDLVRSVEVPLPPLSQQKLFVTRLDGLSTEMQHLESMYQKKLAKLHELKQSILNKAFAGELTDKPEPVIKEEAIA